MSVDDQLSKVGLPTSAPLDEMDQLRVRVEALERAAPERAKPWYRQAANVLSIVAVIASAGVILFQVYVEKRGQEVAELQQIALDTVENRKAIADEASSQTNATSVALIESFLNAKSNALLSRGEELVSQYKGNIPPEVPYILAFEAQNDMRYAEAETLYLRALKQPRNLPTEIANQLGLASLYMIPGTGIEDLAKAEKLFGKALGLVPTGESQFVISERAYIYWMWGQSEIMSGNVTTGLQKYSTAEALYQSLPLNNPARAPSLQDLRRSSSLSFHFSGVGQVIASKLTGQWNTVNGSSDGNMGSGKLTVTHDPDSGVLNAWFSWAPDASNVANTFVIRGTISLQDVNTALFTWQSAAPAGVAPVQGTMNLKLDDAVKVINAVQERPSPASVSYKLVKQ